MVQTGKPHIPWNLSVDGTLVCTPDIWGNRFAPPESVVEFRTSDAHYISLFHQSTFGVERTDPAGMFSITSSNHPQIIPDDSYFLEITNSVTLQIQKYPIRSGIHQVATVGNTSHISMGEIQVPWTPEVPVIAKINGREFKYPGDVARALLVRFRSYGGSTQAEVYFSFAGQPDPDAELDSLLSVIEAEGRKPGSSEKSNKFLSEISKALGINLMQVRKPLDVVTLALEKFSNTRFNTETIKDFQSFNLDRAVRNAFGVKSPFFLMLKGRAAFCVVLFSVGCVARGQKITVSAADIGQNHVASVSV